MQHLETKKELLSELRKRKYPISTQQLNNLVDWPSPYGEGDVAEIISKIESLPPPRWSVQTINFLSTHLTKMRRTRQYKLDIQRFRENLLHIPAQGYTRIEVKREIQPLARAFLNYMNCKRGSGKYKNEAVLFFIYVRLSERFAQEHPLAKGRPMPTFIALRELLYKNPPSHFVLNGYFSNQDGIVKVWLEDVKTEAPYRVSRLVKQAVARKDSKAAKQISIFQKEPNWGKWEFRQLK